MNMLTFIPKLLKKSQAQTSSSKTKTATRLIALATTVAYIGGLWLHWIHEMEGGHEAIEISPILHWLRDSSLAFPLILVATWLGLWISSTILRRNGWQASRRRSYAVEVTLVVLLTSGFILAGNPVHAALFGASHQHEASFTAHLLRDGLLAMLSNLLITGIFVLIWPVGGIDRGTSHQPISKNRVLVRRVVVVSVLFLTGLLISPLSALTGTLQLLPQTATAADACIRTIHADIVALDQPFYYNRLGAIQANGMMYALTRDVVVKNNVLDGAGNVLIEQFTPLSTLNDSQVVGLAGNVMLRADKRARPIVLRMNEGDCLAINFTNLLDPVEFIFNLPPEFPTGQILGLGVPINPQIQDQPLTRQASIHIDGLYLQGDIGSDGSNVGQNTTSSLVSPGASTTYIYHADHEATHLMYSMGATIGADGGGGARTYGLFGAVNVQKAGAEWYRSQLTRQEMDWATPAEAFTDWNGNGVWNQNIPEENITGSASTDSVGTLGDGLTDFVSSGVQTGWKVINTTTNSTAADVTSVSVNQLTLNSEIIFTTGDSYIVFDDWNGSGIWDASVTEPLFDTNADGVFNAHRTTPGGQPILDYDAVYPQTQQNDDLGKTGLPIINMLDGLELVHTDINAIITGPNKGRFLDGTYQDNLATGDRNAPYREFTVIFHDDAFGVQAFPAFYNDPVMKHTLAGVTDSFPINYGSGGIGSEIIANRLGVGPMWDCAECKYEEFFLTSWTVGDPAMIVDIPANTCAIDPQNPNGPCEIIPGAKATKALYPEDPSNVHHSYLSDRVKFRNLHAGPKEHHIFHLHAHQWLFNPDDPQSNYLDGQAIGPGSGYTYEIAYGGSGNRNKTAGDSIFHCHFYPHFAQGMWEMWRVHDTYQQGTLMDIDVDGLPIPAPGSRALPDGEIAAGTPIPGVVPIPTNAMAPMPFAAATIVASDLNNDGSDDSSQFDANGDGVADIFQIQDANNDGIGDPLPGLNINPGYPWYIPGLLGHRPPSPALDLLDDGGLPRHVITSGPDEDNLAHAGAPIEMYVSRLDFNKVLHEASAVQIPEGGTAAEQVAMNFHAQQFWPTYSPLLDPATGLPVAADFETNGLPPTAGAPYADPCRAFSGAGPWTLDYPNGGVRTIKGANIEMPVVLNKVGWHFQQQRFEALWEDVVPTLTHARAPQPMIMRLNSTDCAEFWHTNLVPNVYQLDDYQVRTPTDIIGQHIHLVKFDVMSADGSANGWNYEDGTLSPDEVRERIEAFNNGRAIDDGLGGLISAPAFKDLNGNYINLAPEAHPFFGAMGPDGQNWQGARTTIQRWYADPLLQRSWDGGVGTVFTHDHYGPSTHQQVGLYSTLLVEPEGSVWRHNETGELLGTRPDGGPTTWQAIIEVPEALWTDLNGDEVVDEHDDPTHREFYFEFADFQHAYERGRAVESVLVPNENLLGLSVPIDSYADFAGAINPSFRLPPANPADIYIHPNWCPGTTFNAAGNPLNVVPRPCPEAISADDPGTYALNFRNEPIGLRVFDGVVGADGPLGVDGGQTPGLAGDLSFAYQSRTDRAIPELNVQPETNGISPYPPLTADVEPGDPWTPLLRVYMGDKVRIRVQVGAHEEEHNFTIPGLKWRKEPNSPNSGWKNSEFFGIDEYFNLDVPIVPDTSNGSPNRVDYIYTVGAELEGMWNGVWGILRSYGSSRNDLYELPNNDVGRNGYAISNEAYFNGICPLTAPLKTFDVTAVRAIDVLDPVQGLVYNDRLTTLQALPGGIKGQGPLIDPTATIYVLDGDLTYDPATDTPDGLQPEAPVEPLILRVNAGDCVQVNLTNALPADLGATEMPGWNSMPPIVQKDENLVNPGQGGILTFNANDITPSSYVGLTPQLLAFDPRSDGGFSTGLTTGRLVAPGDTVPYTWYAGDITVTNAGVQGNRTQFTLGFSPVEFGAAGLIPADRTKGTENGLVGAIIVEPQDSCWIADPGTRAQATVWKSAKDGTNSLIGECGVTPTTSTDSFRDFVTIMQNDINLRYGGTVQVLSEPDPITGAVTVLETIDCGDPNQMPRMECAVPNIAAEGPLGPTEESQDSGQKAINYKSDPPWFRLGVVPDFFQILHRVAGLKDHIANVFSNFLNIGAGPVGDPQTVVYRASPDGPQYGRFRVLMPGGHARGVSYTLHGHQWQTQPYINGSSDIGNNSISEYFGTQEGINPTGHWDFVVDLGGPFDIAGDYLWRDQGGFGSFQGLWGLLRFDFTPPEVADAAYTLAKYTSIDIDLLGGAFDLDDDAASVTITGRPTDGALAEILDASGNGTGVFTYQSLTWPPCDDAFSCEDSFSYTIADGQGLVSNTGTVTITVTNTAPQANNDTIIIKDPAPLGFVDVLLNDFDAEADVLNGRIYLPVNVQPEIDPNGVGGTVSVTDSTVTYSGPFTNAGVVVIPYTITDESGAGSNVASIRVAVNVDDITITQTRYQQQNGNWTIGGTCTDPLHLDGQTPTIITIYSGPLIGGSDVIGTVQCVVGDPVGTWSFSGTSAAPAPDPNAENFVSAQSDFVTPSGGGFYEGYPVTFAGKNNAPVATNDNYTIIEDTVLNDNVLANDVDADFDPLTAVLVTDVATGTLALKADGTFTYTPNADFNGSDSFTYQADDGKDVSGVATVTITIDAVNDLPTAVDDGYSMAQGASLNVAAPGVRGNDSDVEGDAFDLNTTPLSGPVSGNSLVLNADGSFTYTPFPGDATNPAFTGVDSFVYEICETATPELLCSQATVTISVGVNDAPVAADDAYNAVQNTDLVVAAPGVLTNDSDADNTPPANPYDGLTAVLVTGPVNGTLTIDPDGGFTYTPLFNFVGVDSFTYVAKDGTVDSNVATVTITVEDVVTVTSATFRTRQGRWNIQGTVLNAGSSVDVYLNGVAPENLIGAASVDEISGDWSFTGTGLVSSTCLPGEDPCPDTVIAISSGGGVSAPFQVNVRK